jgi:hypothetical protein
MCASTALTVLWFQRSQMKATFHHMLLVWCDSEIHHHLCGTALKVKAEANLCILCAPVSIFWTHPVQNLWYPSLTVIISYRTAWNLWKITQSSEIVKHCLSQIFWPTLWTRSYSLTTNGRTLWSSSRTFVRPPIFEHSTPLSYSSFTYYILAVNHA